MTKDEEPLPFWLDDGTPCAGASREEIAAAETYTGRTLPPALTELLLQRDGGVSYYAFHVDDLYVPLPGLFSVSMIVNSFDVAAQFGTPDGVIAIAGGGHSWLGLDYRADTDPAVVYQESEDDDLQTIAGSFGDFLAGLVEEV